MSKDTLERMEKISREQKLKVDAHMKKHYNGTIWDGESYSINERGRVYMNSNPFIWTDTYIKANY